MMKLWIASIVLTVTCAGTAFADGCPSLIGDFVLQCPPANTAFTAIRITQTGCTAIGRQSVGFDKTGKAVKWGKVSWEPIGGRYLDQDGADSATYVDRFYSESTLYSNVSVLDKKTNKFRLTRINLISILGDGNLFISYPDIAQDATVYPVGYCFSR